MSGSIETLICEYTYVFSEVTDLQIWDLQVFFGFGK